MAEVAPDIQNKKLLVIAIVLALVVVVVYNLHVTSIRKSAVGEMVDLLVLTRDMQAGEQISAKDIKKIQIGHQVVKRLGSYVPADEYDYVTGGALLNQPVVKDQILMAYHITPGALEGHKFSPGKIQTALKVDPTLALGQVLRVGNFVNVLAYLSVDNRPLAAWRIIEGVRVVAIGGVGRQEIAAPKRGSRSKTEGMRSFRSVTIEVNKDQSLKLANVISHARSGQVWLELRGLPEASEVSGKVNEELESLAEEAARSK